MVALSLLSGEFALFGFQVVTSDEFCNELETRLDAVNPFHVFNVEVHCFARDAQNFADFPV